MDHVSITNVERRGPDTHADLPLRSQWTREERAIAVEVAAGRTIEVKLHPAMTEGTVLRLKGQASDGDGDLLLRIHITNGGGGRPHRARIPADRDDHERKVGRVAMSIWVIAAGLVLILAGARWRFGIIPAPWVGYLLIAVGVLGLLGLSTFRGGPYDRRLDRPGGRPPDQP
jgi:hypothetical protein